ncbi:MAG: hypothetical protein WD749_10680 [Phycisphaerales bacterium]
MNWRSLRNPAFLVALAVLGASAAGMGTALTMMRVVLQKRPIYAEGSPYRALRAIPTETERWVRVGADQIERPDVAEELGTDNYLTRVYLERAPRPGRPPRALQIHAAYYTGMVDTVPHVPDRCFVGGGYSITGGPWVLDMPLDQSAWLPAQDLPESLAGRVFTIRLSHQFSTAGPGRRVNLPTGLAPGAPLQIRITEFSGPRGGKRLEGYFFIANGEPVSSAEGVRLKAFDLRSEYAYYLKIQVGSSDLASAEELAAASGDLLSDLLGELMTCVPDWVKVERGEWPPDNPARAKPGMDPVRR